ncbi:MAG: MarR family transcriptional regulator [Actinomycetia bacterium]|nr:MarR family transcriptional regulator [Actinomycetes bacterium]
MDNRKKTIEEITEALYSIRRRIASEMHHLFDEMKITHPQWIVLHHVKKSGMINIKDLAKLLDITSSAATQIVDGLVKKGLLLRKRNKEDRRILNIELSAIARDKFDSIKSASFNTLSTLFDALDDEELQNYRDLNNKIVSRIPAGSTGRKEKD